MDELIMNILEQLDQIADTLKLHNDALLMLVNDSIAKEGQKGIFNDMDFDIQEFWANLDCYRREDD